MKTLNLTVALLFAVAVTSLFANDGSFNPAPRRRILSNDFLYTIRNYSAFVGKNVANNTTSNKVCSCQILNVKSNNEQITQVALLAEKTNHGDISADLSVADAIIEKAKKQIKAQFYNTVKVVAKWQQTLPCATLYHQLKAANNDVQMFDILDADILNRK
jgi:hypothetical protein